MLSSKAPSVRRGVLQSLKGATDELTEKEESRLRKRVLAKTEQTLIKEVSPNK